MPSARAVVLREVYRLRRKLAHTRPLVAKIGMIILMESKRSFIAQKLGDIEWPERYPGLRRPFINIAGALADFIKGNTSPAPSQFQDRPALLGTGALQASIKSEVVHPVLVVVKSDKPYSKLQYEGGTSSQTYGDDTKARIHNWLFEPREKLGPRGRMWKPREGRDGYIKHLAPLLRKNEHVQNVAARPFIGITDQAEDQMREAILKHFARRTG